MEIAFILIWTKHGKNRLVQKALSKHPQIVEIHEIYGQYDLIAKVVADNRHALKDFIQNTLMIAEGIVRTETMLVTDVEEDEDGHERDDAEYEADGEID